MSHSSSPGPLSGVRRGYDRWAPVYDHDANPLPALEEARRKSVGLEIEYLEHDLHQPLPMPDASFDLGVSGLVLEHLTDLDSFFAELRRVLRPTGRAVVSAMHPAMFLRDSQARFTDPESGDVIQPGSFPHQIGDFVMAAVRAGFEMEGIQEHAPNSQFVLRYPRAEKYLDWPMLVVLQMKA